MNSLTSVKRSYYMLEDEPIWRSDRIFDLTETECWELYTELLIELRWAAFRGV